MGAGFVALTGDLPGTMAYIKSCGPLLTIPLKGLIAFPVVYHYVAGMLPSIRYDPFINVLFFIFGVSLQASGTCYGIMARLEISQTKAACLSWMKSRSHPNSYCTAAQACQQF